MNKLVLLVCCFLTACHSVVEPVSYQTVCNPVDLSYRYCLNWETPYREAADPSIVPFKGGYYLFVSKSGGYFYSTDLIHWDLIQPEGEFPLENYAPTAVVINDAIYFITSGHHQVLRSSDPQSGKWEVAQAKFPLTYTDPALLLDDDGRLYYYAGCSNVDPIQGIELDAKTLEPTGELLPMLNSHREKYGWEVQGDNNTRFHTAPWIEGAWANKHNGKYYLQYAGPGTEFPSYNDGVYVSDKPLGPFILANHNPFAYKPAGFANGAGHGSTFQDEYGNYWHIGTISISMRFSFERRLALFPVFFDDDGEMYAYTGFGDYPYIMPNKKINSPEELFPEWMLLSYRKKVEASSTLEPYPAKYFRSYAEQHDTEEMTSFEPQKAVDEDIRTWWSAASGDEGEWFSIDLGEQYSVYALQINFADEGSQRYGLTDNNFYLYTVEQSSNGEKWETLVDKSQNTTDAVHEYVQLPQPVKTRFLRINNIKTPSGKFSLYDFRVFGKSEQPLPNEVKTLNARRDDDKRTAHLSWDSVPSATGYNVRFGIAQDKLYQNYMVYDTNKLSIHILNAEKPYFFTVDAFNESGVTKGTTIVKIE
jgi:hypothetical protein